MHIKERGHGHNPSAAGPTANAKANARARVRAIGRPMAGTPREVVAGQPAVRKSHGEYVTHNGRQERVLSAVAYMSTDTDQQPRAAQSPRLRDAGNPRVDLRVEDLRAP